MRWKIVRLGCAVQLVVARTAQAGMPSFGFTEIAGLRFQAISFFLAVLLLSGALIRGLWNALASDVPRLPRLSYTGACGIVGLWGLLFVVVLTMISGARELMTPGAWRKQGVTYTLADHSNGDQDTADSTVVGSAATNEYFADQSLALRRVQLAELRFQLHRYANKHEDRFPPPDETTIDENVWQMPDPSEMHYVYIEGRTMDHEGLPLAFEAELFPGEPLVLLVGGEIVSMPREELSRFTEHKATKTDAERMTP